MTPSTDFDAATVLATVIRIERREHDRREHDRGEMDRRKSAYEDYRKGNDYE